MASSSGVALVLGGGGTVGLAYHAGVLRALELEAGFRPDDADLVVGTSAGAVAGAYLRCGHSTRDLWDVAMGTDPSLEGLTQRERDERARSILAPAFTDPVTLARRLVGSGYVAGRAFLRLPAPWLRVPAVLQRAFPGGVFAMAEGRRRFADDLPDAWPRKPLWLCTVDIDDGRRVVLGRSRGENTASLRAAVAASCAIPVVYPPVRLGGRTLVDGGVHSTTNLDLAATAGSRLIIGVAPMAFDTGASLPSPFTQLVRRVPARMLVDEMSAARAKGAEVLLIRPSAGELRVHGMNLMRREGWDRVATAAYDGAARQLATDRFRRAFEERAA